MRFWLTAALLLGACDSERRVDPGEARLAAIARRLEAAAAVAEPTGAPPDVALPRSAAGGPLEGAPPLLVVSETVIFAGRGVGGIEAADRAAETLREDMTSWAAAEQRGDGELPVALWAAPDVTAGALTELLRHAPRRARFALLVRGPPGEARDDEPRWVEPALRARAGRPESFRERSAQAWERATRACEAAAPHLPIPAPLAPAGPPLGAPTVDDLVAALRTCGCDGVDLPAMEAVATRALVDRAGPVRRLPPTLRFGPPTDDAPALEPAPDTPVDALVESLAQREGALWIRAD